MVKVGEWADALYAVVSLAVLLGYIYYAHRSEIDARIKSVIEHQRARALETYRLNRMWECGPS